MLKYYKYILIIVLLFLTNCWNKQDNDINGPNVPKYTLSGQTIEYNTNDILPKTQIKVTAVELLYDAEFNSKTVESDSNGIFTVSGLIPGSYLFSVNSNSIWLESERLSIEHEDRVMDIRVPHIIFGNVHPHVIHDDFDPTGKYLNSSRFVMVNSEYPAFYISGNASTFASNKFESFGASSVGYYFCKTSLDNNTTTFYSAQPSTANLDDIYQLTVDNNNIYALKKPDTLLVIDKWQFYLKQAIPLEYPLQDIIFEPYSKSLLACNDSVLFQINTETFEMNKLTDMPIKTCGALTFHKEMFYVYDNSTHLYHKMLPNFKIQETFAIVHKLNNNHITDVYDIHFDSYNNLWLTQ